MQFELGTTIEIKDSEKVLAELPLKYVKGKGITGVQESVSAKVHISNMAGWLKSRTGFLAIMPETAKTALIDQLAKIEAGTLVVETKDLSFNGGKINIGFNLENLSFTAEEMGLPTVGGLTVGVRGLYVKLKLEIDKLTVPKK